MCVSVTVLAATYLVYMPIVRQYTVSCRLLKVRIVWTLLKTFYLGNMASFACIDEQQLCSFLTKNPPMLLNTIINGLVYEALPRSDDYLN